MILEIINFNREWGESPHKLYKFIIKKNYDMQERFAHPHNAEYPR